MIIPDEWTAIVYKLVKKQDDTQVSDYLDKLNTPIMMSDLK